MVGAAAWAQPRISVHPLMVNQEELEKGNGRAVRWNNLFMQEVAKQNIHMTPEPEVAEFLAQRAEGSCRNNDKCLRDLGYATETYYILSVQMMGVRDENEVEVSFILNARVLRVDGQEMRRVSVTQNRVSKTSVAANAVAAYERLFKELMLEDLPPQPRGVSLVPPRIETVTEIKVVPEGHYSIPGYGILSESQLKELLSQGMTPTRKSAYALWGVAGAAVVTGTVFALLAGKNRQKYDINFSSEYSSKDRSVVSHDRDMTAGKKLRQCISTQQTVSISAFSVAAAAAIAGTVLFFISPESYYKPTLSVGFRPTNGGAMFSLQGVFP